MTSILDARLITAIKTPYDSQGKIDFDAYDRHVATQINGGVQGLVVGGTTGEGHLMDWEEHLILIAHTVNYFGSQLQVIGNTGSNNTKEAVRATEEGFAVGMNAALQINPYYGKTSRAGLVAHFKAVLALGPALIYNVPGRTGQDLQPDLIQELAQHKHFVGVKECAGIDRIAQYEQAGIACWSGNDDQAHDSRHKAGSHGVISVASNILPKTMASLMDDQNGGLNQKLQDLLNWFFCEPNPIALNTLMPMLGYCRPVFRLPYVPLNAEARLRGATLLEAAPILDKLPKLMVLNDNEFTFAP